MPNEDSLATRGMDVATIGAVMRELGNIEGQLKAVVDKQNANFHAMEALRDEIREDIKSLTSQVIPDGSRRIDRLETDIRDNQKAISETQRTIAWYAGAAAVLGAFGSLLLNQLLGAG